MNPKLSKYEKILKKIKKLRPKYTEMPDEELQKQTQLFRNRIKAGEKLEKILPEAYCVISEADKRVLGLDPYDVQILGGIVLFFGNIAEMKTGEGKTLTATLPMYLHGLRGSGNFVVTSNEYLAWRDAENVGKVYRWLGLSVSVGVMRDDFGQELDKMSVYSSDIVYTTHSALGFDYLLNNLAVEKELQYLKPFRFVLIDEVDSILMDMAQTPLIISGAPKLQSNLPEISDKFVKGLIENIDYERSEDKKRVWFLPEGIYHAEAYFGVKNILGENYADLYRHIVLALKANHTFRSNRDYVVDNGEIILLDEMNGRKLEGTKLQGGMHQALEAKENLDITEETKSMGSITYQNLFKLFDILSGMTGTAMTDKEELRETYDVDVIALPTHRKIIRVDHEEKIYASHKGKILHTLEQVKELRKTGRPLLIATGSVSKSNLYSMLLLDNRIPHSLLNASTASKEAEIIAEAGKKGAVTVATSMAGRGTDIKLDDFSRKHGGLVVIGTENMTSERIDNQLRGRAGRQGEPGDSYFYASLEDQLVVENAPEWVKKHRKKQEKVVRQELKEKQVNDGLLVKRKYKRLVRKSQKNKKNQDIYMRKETLDYDDIVSVIRNRVYDSRDYLMSANYENLQEIIIDSINQAITAFIDNKKNLKGTTFTNFISNNIDYSYREHKYNGDYMFTRSEGSDYLFRVITERTAAVEATFLDIKQTEYFMRLCAIKALDSLWIDLSDGLVQLKTIVKNRNWGQHQPLNEFQKEAERYFYETRDKLRLDIMRNFLLSELFTNSDGSMDVEFP